MRAFLLLPFLATPVFADLKICNETAIRATVAIGYAQDGDWVSEGWWTVKAGDCRTIIKGDLPKRYYYWRATTREGAFAEGGFSFCTQSEPFTIEGDSDCEARGYETAFFREEDIGEARDHTITLAQKDAPKDTARKSAAKPQTRIAPASPARISDAGPGTYGEPLSITANFGGCWATNEVQECEFTADGWTYVASEEGPTDLGIIDALNVFDIGTRLQVSGDLISYSGDRADIMVRSIEAAPSASSSATASVSMEGLMQHLQGYWDSDAGDGYGWAIEGNILRVIYDANLVEEYAFELYPECAASDGQGPVIIGWPEIDPSMGPACFLVTETAQRHLAVRDMVENIAYSFSYSN